MSRNKIIADVRGARGSNAGDQFHELWALEQILALLDVGTNLRAVTVEGIVAPQWRTTPEESTWDGVDCGLFFSGPTLATAQHLEFVQLKYSSDPDKRWSIARLTTSAAKKGNNSVMRTLAEDFMAARRKMRSDATLTLRFISNQPVDGEVQSLVDAVASGGRLTGSLSTQRERVARASGLRGEDLRRFMNALDFSECGRASRFAQRERVALTLAKLVEDNATSDAAELGQRVRELMLPERRGEAVTRQTILSWFGIADESGLFPCPRETTKVEHPVTRQVSQDLAGLLLAGNKVTCLHGSGGCGKTTAVQQLSELLPDGSCCVLFDCFGGGRYLFSDDRRHLPQQAFLQIVNDVGLALRTPLLLAPGTHHPVNTRQFLKRLTDQATVLAQENPDAFLVIVVDAADNAVAAARLAGASEACFVHDLCHANLAELPANVRIVLTARSARLDSLGLPSIATKLECPPFSQPETARYARSFWPDVSDAWVEQFHHLSNRVPRVQAYAIEAAEDPQDALDALRPGSKSLDQVLQQLFEAACRKIGNEELFDSLLAGLAVLPPPIPPIHLAAVAGTDDQTVADLAHDLSPGLRLGEDGVSIADEDFEAFIHERSSPNRELVTARVADYLHDNYRVDSYAATHVAEALVVAGRGKDLLQLIQDDPQVEALNDPVARQEVSLQRLKLALHVCRSTGSTTEAIKVILMSADATEEEHILRDILEKESDLAVTFAWPSLRRLVLADSDSVRRQGTVLAQDAARAARTGDYITARERVAAHDAWLRRWAALPANERHRWGLSIKDVVARAEALLEFEGPEAAIEEIYRWRPSAFRLEVALKLIPSLLAAGKQGAVKDALDRSLVPEPWNLLLLVPLAWSGAPSETARVSASLSKLTVEHVRASDLSARQTRSDVWEDSWFELLITACELAVHLAVDQAVVRGALHLLRVELWPHPARWVPLSIDALLRVWLLEQHLDDAPTTLEALVAALKSERSANDESEQSPGEEHTSTARDTQYDDLVSNLEALLPIYVGRLRIIADHDYVSDEESVAREIPSGPKNSHSFDRNWRSRSLREDAAISIMQLMAIPGISCSGLFVRAGSIIEGEWGNLLGTRNLPLLEYLLLRRDGHAEVLKTVTQAATSIQAAPVPSSEKISAVVRFSRLLLPVSTSESECLFSSIVEFAQEVDRETFDQIESLSQLSASCSAITDEERHSLATGIFHFVSSAAERLSDYEEFPWEAAVVALERLSFPSALSAVALWADSGKVDLQTALRPLLSEAVTRQDLPADAATALAILLDVPNTELTDRILAGTGSRTQKLCISEELARDCLLHAPQADRLALGRQLLSCVDEEAPRFSHVLSQLTAMVSFLSSLLPPAGTSEPKVESPPAHSASSNPELAGIRFTSIDAIQRVLEDRGPTLETSSTRDLLTRMRELASVFDRVPFLTALIDVESALIREDERAEVLLEALRAWGESLALERWRMRDLRRYIVQRFADLAPRFAWEPTLLTDLLEATGISGSDRVWLLAECVEAAGSSLHSRLLRKVAELIAAGIPTANVSEVLVWYVDRLGSRVQIESGQSRNVVDVPATGIDAVGRFLFALLGDIDTRVRWRAAHTVRRLARLGATNFLDAVVSNWNRTSDNAFRDPDAPYYWVSARLWLVMTLNRISAEVPAAIVPHEQLLLRAATDPELPHILIREHAKKAVLRLVRDGHTTVSDTDLDFLRTANELRLPRTEVERPHGSGYRSDPRPEHEQAFHFDLFETVPYLYSPLLHLFPQAEMEDILNRAEHWIVERWGASATSTWWATEPRKGRYDERRYGLWMPSHGSSPKVERYGYYLEWNAMMCVVGELLNSHAVTNQDEGFRTFEGWFARFLTTEPEYWLADIREPTPLDARQWGAELSAADAPLESLATGELIAELGIRGPTHPEWLVVGASYDIHLASRELHTAISSSLVSPRTASALVRALQSANDPNDFRLPNEGDEAEIEREPYHLMGWLSGNRVELGFDERDPLRHQAVPAREVPGNSVESLLGLERYSGTQATWTLASTGAKVVVAEVWNDLSEDDSERWSHKTASGGWRLWMRAPDLQAFLAHEDMDLICEVQTVSRSHREGSYRYESQDGEPRTDDGILLLRQDGWIEDATGHIGTWSAARRTASA